MANEQHSYEEIEKALADARRAMDEFKRTRFVTEAMLNGVVPTRKGLSHDKIVARIRAARDPLKEKRAARDYRDFMRLLLGREPTLQELRNGIPPLSDIYPEEEDLGLIPLLLAAAPVVLGGAWGLSSVFGYMTAHEQRAQQEIAEQASMLDTARAWALPAALAVGVGSLGWVWLSRRKKKAKAKKAEAAPAPEAKGVRNPEEEDEEIVEELEETELADLDDAAELPEPEEPDDEEPDDEEE